MKALQLHGHRDIRLDDVPTPSAPSGWSVVKVAWSAICHSDLREWFGPSYIGRTGKPNEITGVYFPVTLGHEFAGTVVEMNGTHPTIKTGDRVAPDGCIYCGTCWYCTHGHYNLCDNIAVLGFDAHGSHAQHVAVPNYSLYKLPDSVSDKQGALIEPLSVAMHGVRQGQVKLGDTVVIVGAGTIGLCALAVAKAAGAAQVFVSEPMPFRRARAAEMGATVLDPNDGDIVRQLRDMTSGPGADVALDCVGTEASLNSALALSRRAGRVVLVGVMTSRPAIDIDKIGLDERELTGSLAYANDFQRSIALVADGRVKLDGLITAEIPLRDIVEDGYERFERDAKDHLRIIVDCQAI